MKLGIGSYTFAWAIGVPGHPPAAPMDAFGLLAAAGDLGVRVVQVCDNLPLTALSPAERERFIGEAADRGIEVEVGTRGLDPADLHAHLALARRFGTPFVRVVIDRGRDEPAPDEVVRRLTPVLEEFDAAGVKLAIENHDRFRARDLAALVERLGPERVGVCLDTVNSFGALEGPDVVVPTLAPYTLSLHVKDFTIRRVDHQMGFVVEGCPAGAGRLDVPSVIAALRDAGRDPNAILELWPAPSGDLEETIARERAWAQESVARLRAWIPD